MSCLPDIYQLKFIDSSIHTHFLSLIKIVYHKFNNMPTFKIFGLGRMTALTIAYTVILSFLFPAYARVTEQAEIKNSNKVEGEVLWHVKAIHPEGFFLDVKAIDEEGRFYDLKAVQDADQNTLMDIKVVMNGKRIPVKILQSDGRFMPVKGIMKNGQILDIKAINLKGEKLDVKGIGHSGNIIHIKAITKNREFYGVKAISPSGELNDIKGVKVTKDPIEGSVNGVLIHAHVKALSQTGCSSDSFIWHIKAIHPEGYTLDVKALDKSGNLFDIKAIHNSNQRSLLDIKAFIGDALQLPVKVIRIADGQLSAKAIAENGDLYDIKAIDKDGKQLDVIGSGRAGNLVHIKALNQEGEMYGVKAISPDGELNAVKGVKMLKEELELEISGVKIFAHIKAVPQ